MAPRRIKARPRTSGEKDEEQKTRDFFQDRPTVRSLIERGEIDPERVTTGPAEASLMKTLVALRRARLDRGLSLAEVSQRSGIDPSVLCRLEGGKNPNPTFETLSRYADALGLCLELSLVESNAPVQVKSSR